MIFNDGNNFILASRKLITYCLLYIEHSLVALVRRTEVVIEIQGHKSCRIFTSHFCVCMHVFVLLTAADNQLMNSTKAYHCLITAALVTRSLDIAHGLYKRKNQKRMLVIHFIWQRI